MLGAMCKILALLGVCLDMYYLCILTKNPFGRNYHTRTKLTKLPQPSSPILVTILESLPESKKISKISTKKKTKKKMNRVGLEPTPLS
jgi:hypothetical protein